MERTEYQINDNEMLTANCGYRNIRILLNAQLVGITGFNGSIDLLTIPRYNVLTASTFGLCVTAL